MNMNMKTNSKLNKRIVCLIVIIAVLTSVVLTACEKPDIYKLIENMLKTGNDSNGNLYHFTADLKIKIGNEDLSVGMPMQVGEDILDSVPSELNFKFDGKVKNSAGKPAEFVITAEIGDIPGTSGVKQQLKTTIYGKNNMLYFELNDISKVVMNFLSAGGFLDIPIKNMFENHISYDSKTVLCFDITGLDLAWFDRYISWIDEYFNVTSTVKTVKHDVGSSGDFSVPDFDKSKTKYFDDIKSQIDKDLLKITYYRYSDLYIILSVDNNKSNYINILATRESGKKEVLEKVKIDCDISKIIKDPKLLLSANVLPMRYILELLGESVDWDDASKKAYIVNSAGEKVFFESEIIDSKAYINLVQILTKTNYGLQNGAEDNYIEFRIYRK